MSPSTVTVLLVLLAMSFAASCWGVIDGANRPVDAWTTARRDEGRWTTLQLLFGIFGVLAYVIFVRPKLKSVERVANH
ncbi:MAG: hypothetical protein KY434_09780 [Actinobacteria bacterium]|nr:hypothetical protein [Actinomycetota bacterium]